MLWKIRVRHNIFQPYSSIALMSDMQCEVAKDGVTTYQAVHLAVSGAFRCSKQYLWFPLQVENHQ